MIDWRVLLKVAAALLLAVVGVLAYAAYAGSPVGEIWPPVIVAVLIPHVVALAAAVAGRPGLLMATAVLAVILSFLLVFAVGFGVWQLPAAFLLLVTAVKVPKPEPVGAGLNWGRVWLGQSD